MSMSTIATVQTPADTLQRLDVTLLGPAVWRQYQQGAHPALLADLYGDPHRHYNDKVKHVCRILSLYRQTAAFTGMPAMAALVQQHVKTFEPVLQELFEQQWFVLHREVEEVFLPNYAVDDYFYEAEFAWVKKFITCVLGVAGLSEELLLAVAPLWFEIVDAALSAPEAVAS